MNQIREEMSDFKFASLSKDKQVEYKKVAQSMFGETYVFSEHGEPLYFDENGVINPIYQFVLDRMELIKNSN